MGSNAEVAARSAIVALALAASVAGCGGGAMPGREGPLRVVSTTGMIADAAREVGGPHVTVTGLMGPGVDPHLYKASEGDLERLGGADLILYNGLNLEGKMGDLLVRMSRDRATVPVSEGIPDTLLREPPAFEWFLRVADGDGRRVTIERTQPWSAIRATVESHRAAGRRAIALPVLARNAG